MSVAARAAAVAALLAAVIGPGPALGAAARGPAGAAASLRFCSCELGENPRRKRRTARAETAQRDGLARFVFELDWSSSRYAALKTQRARARLQLSLFVRVAHPEVAEGSLHLRHSREKSGRIEVRARGLGERPKEKKTEWICLNCVREGKRED